MARGDVGVIGRRAFLAGAGTLLACARGSKRAVDDAAAADAETMPTSASHEERDDRDVGPRSLPSKFPLFDAFPSLASALPRVVLACLPSAAESATNLVDGASVFVKRDDDFTRSLSYDEGDPHDDPARTFGGGKLRKLEFFFGEARAKGARTIVTFGGVGSNQALATALLGRALGFGVRLYLAPQPPSSLTTGNLGADTASRAEMRLFSSTIEAQAAAAREGSADATLYAIPPGGTTPVGTIGFVNAGMELAEDVRAGRLPAPRRIYVALGLGGTCVGLAIGCALAGLRTEIVAVRASNPSTVSTTTLRSIHARTLAFLRAHSPTIPALEFDETALRIDGRFVGRGYGFPTTEGDDAVKLARLRQDWTLDPVYTGKALAALIADAKSNDPSPVLFWNTANSRAVPHAAVVEPFRRFLG